jgi:hypothetical protein
MNVNFESAPVAPPPQSCQGLTALSALTALLDTAMDSLSQGDAVALLEVSPDITRAVQRILADGLGSFSCLATEGSEQERRQFLQRLSQQRLFCRAMLRRWRRSLAIREQLLEMRAEPLIYRQSMKNDMELP